MGLRVGLVVPNNWTPEAGGGWTFTEAILKALPGVPAAHRFLILDLDSGGTGGQHCKIAPPAQPGLLSQTAASIAGGIGPASRCRCGLVLNSDGRAFAAPLYRNRLGS